MRSIWGHCTSSKHILLCSAMQMLSLLPVWGGPVVAEGRVHFCSDAVPQWGWGIPFAGSTGSVPGQQRVLGGPESTRRAAGVKREGKDKKKEKKAVTEETGLSSLCRALGFSRKGLCVP